MNEFFSKVFFFNAKVFVKSENLFFSPPRLADVMYYSAQWTSAQTKDSSLAVVQQRIVSARGERFAIEMVDVQYFGFFSELPMLFFGCGHRWPFNRTETMHENFKRLTVNSTNLATIFFSVSALKEPAMKLSFKRSSTWAIPVRFVSFGDLN
jgi:hypothetical protein